MASFSAARRSAEATPKAPRIVVVPVSAFADTWTKKPAAPVEMGLRLVAARDIDTARAEAAREAIDWYDDGEGGCIDEVARDEAYNEALMRHALARALCQPHNTQQPFFQVASETIRLALTSEGLRLLWDELVRLHRGTGVNQPPIEADEVAELAAILARSGSVDCLPESSRGEVRRLLAHCLAELRAANPEAEEPEDDGVATYTAKAG